MMNNEAEDRIESHSQLALMLSEAAWWIISNFSQKPRHLCQTDFEVIRQEQACKETLSCSPHF